MALVLDGSVNTISGLAVGGLGMSVVNSASIQDGAVTPADTQVGALPSMAQMNTANNYGSSNTAIRRLTNSVVNQGADITYADSATLGALFTINTNGVYAISYTDSFSASANFGISLNASGADLTTNVRDIAIAKRLATAVSSAANLSMSVAWIGYLTAGSLIRPHADLTTSGIVNMLFTITRVA